MLARVRSNLALADLFVAAVMVNQYPIETLEDAFAEHFGFPHGLLFPYGRSALHALISALEWRNREVLCPAYICAEVPYAISVSGNAVRFVDSAPQHFLPGSAEWNARVSPTSAMAILTPLFGYPIDPRCQLAIRRAARDIFILSDESHSYDSDVHCRAADGALFSLGLGKTITALSGGVLLLRDSAVYRLVKTFRERYYQRPTTWHTTRQIISGIAAWFAFREPAVTILDILARRFRLLPTEDKDWLPNQMPVLPPDAMIMSSRYDAKVGIRQLASLAAVLAARRKTGEHYNRRLKEEGFQTFEYTRVPTWPRFPWSVSNRKSVVHALRQQGVQVSMVFPYSCADLAAYEDQSSSCPHASVWGRSMINLPNWSGLQIAQAERIIRALTRVRDLDHESVAWPTDCRVSPGQPIDA